MRTAATAPAPRPMSIPGRIAALGQHSWGIPSHGASTHQPDGVTQAVGRRSAAATADPQESEDANDARGEPGVPPANP